MARVISIENNINDIDKIEAAAAYHVATGVSASMAA